MNATDARRLSESLNNKKTADLLEKINASIKRAAEQGEYSTVVFISELSKGTEDTIKKVLVEKEFRVTIVPGDQREPETSIVIYWSY